MPAPDIRIETLTAERAQVLLQQLVALLQNIVNNGASIGFLRPLPAETAITYWQTVINALPSHDRILLVAIADNQVVGSVQAELCRKQNGLHRAEIQKLMVATVARRRGIARMLMSAIENEVHGKGRSTLFLDTVHGKPAETVYERLGWIRTGSIPNYAVSPDGEMESTMIFYKLLVQSQELAT